MDIGAGIDEGRGTTMHDGLEFARAVRAARPDEAHRLRHEAQEWLSGLDLPAEDRELVLAAVAEAVENAVEHAYPEGSDGTVELTLWIDPDAVNVSVVDHGHWQPAVDEPTPPGSAARRGRGITLMHRSVDSVAIRHTTDGTVVALRHHRDAGTFPLSPSGGTPDSSGPHDES